MAQIVSDEESGLLKGLRSRLRLSQTELAHRAGVSQSFVSRLERGDVLRPSRAPIERLAAVLGVTVSDLLPLFVQRRPVRFGWEKAPGTMRMGVWECPWTAPAMLAGLSPSGSFSITSRRPPLSASAPRKAPESAHAGRCMPPRELIRRLGANEFDCVLVPSETLRVGGDHLVECAEVARAPDAIHVIAYFPAGVPGGGDTASEGGPDLPAFETARRPVLDVLAERGPVAVFFPFDVGASTAVESIRETFPGIYTPLPIPIETWPRRQESALDRVRSVRGPSLVVAPEPFAGEWERAMRDVSHEWQALSVRRDHLPPGTVKTRLSLSLAFHADRLGTWVWREEVYRFLEQLEYESLDLERGESLALESLASDLGIDPAAFARELATCDFTPRYSAAWVARLRGPVPAAPRKPRAPDRS